MEWPGKTLHAYPELAVFLVVGFGYWLGSVKVMGIGLGSLPKGAISFTGAQTQTAGMAAVQDRSGSPVSVLGYSGTVAIGNILLTVWGTLIVRMVG
jgi:uncharacterized transporter YbjL